MNHFARSALVVLPPRMGRSKVKYMKDIALAAILVAVTSVASAGEAAKIKYPQLVIPGVPDITDITNMDTYSDPDIPNSLFTDEYRLASPKAVKKIALYDGYDKLQKEFFFNSKGGLERTISYVYSTSGVEKSETDYLYDNLGNWVGYKYGGRSYSILYQYKTLDDGTYSLEDKDKKVIFDKSGKVVQVNSFKSGIEIIVAKFSYDDKDRVIEVWNRNAHSNLCFDNCTPLVIDIEYPLEGVAEITDRNILNRNEHVEFSGTRMHKSGLAAEFTYQVDNETNWTLDKHGNWVKRIKSDRTGSASSRREITYR